MGAAEMTTQTSEAATSKNRSFGLLAFGLALIFATAAFFSGLHFGTNLAPNENQEANLFSFLSTQTDPVSGVELDEFWRVWNLLEEKYVSGTTTNITDEDRVTGAIEGLVDSYDDPYTIFLPPTEAEEFAENIAGNFSGVGMEVGMRNNIVTVIAPLPDTPAEKAGILAGDAIVRIDDKTTEGMNVDEAVQRIRGEKGTEVVLTIYREGDIEFREIRIVRDTIAIPTIKTEKRGDTFIIALYSFNAISEMKMQEALREYAESGTHKLVLDLRGNPGGFLQSAVSIAGYFLPTGKVVVRESFGDNADEQVFRSQGKSLGQYEPEEMVVLINGGSASASEILAGALKAHDAATLIGETTFGKGSVQELVDLPSGASLKVTVARWLTPDGTSISDGGLDPDIEIKRTAQQIINDEDPQLEAALEWLSGNKDIAEKYNATSTVPALE